MLLTIGMIVKNEEKYLERCLNGIRPILEQVDSELIIADTGSTDRTVEIARLFTDNVFYFEWIKDFAAARNSTLEKAQGEWFMFVDGDEIFESCDEIIRFFNSGEYKKYNSASYIQRNICEARDGSIIYSDFNAIRMCKLLPETRFINPIHECFNTLGQPLKVLNDYVLHYGYSAAKDSESSKAKFRRNADLLISQYQKGRRSGLLYVQLYEALVQYETEKADMFLEEGIEYCKKNFSTALPILYSKKVTALYNDKCDYEGVLKACDEYFLMDKKIRPGIIAADADITGAQALALHKLERHEEAIEKFIIFFDVYKKYSEGKLNTNDSFLSSLALARKDNFLHLLQSFVYSCTVSGKYELAGEYMKNLSLSDYCMISSLVQVSVWQVMDLLKQLGYSEISQYYRRFNETGREMFRKAVLKEMLYGSTALMSFFETEEDCADYCQPARMVCHIVSLKNASDYKSCLSEMRKLIENYPQLAPLVSAYQKTVLREYEQAQPMTEMQRLAAMIKGNIRNYIALGNIEAAEKTLAEYEKINPGDSEIAGLKEKLK